MLRIVLGAAAAAFLVLVTVTLIEQGTAGADILLENAWGQITLADFYLGVLCFATVIWCVERSVVATLGWTLALALLGNPVAAVWLLARGLRRLEAAFARPPHESA